MKFEFTTINNNNLTLNHTVTDGITINIDGKACEVKRPCILAPYYSNQHESHYITTSKGNIGIADSYVDGMSKFFKDTYRSEEAYEAEQLELKIPGYAILKDTLSECNYRYDTLLNALDRGNAVLPAAAPVEKLKELVAKYPIANCYINAEQQANAHNFDKAAAGKKAMELLLDGGDIKDANNIMNNWSQVDKFSI